jgi:hypothetical protein
MTPAALAGSPNPLTTKYDVSHQKLKKVSRPSIYPCLCHYVLNTVRLRQHLAEKAEIRVGVSKQFPAELCVVLSDHWCGIMTLNKYILRQFAACRIDLPPSTDYYCCHPP